MNPWAQMDDLALMLLKIVGVAVFIGYVADQIVRRINARRCRSLSDYYIQLSLEELDLHKQSQAFRHGIYYEQLAQWWEGRRTTKPTEPTTEQDHATSKPNTTTHEG